MAATTPTASRTTFELPTFLFEGKVGQHLRVHAEAGGGRADLDALGKLVGHAHFQRDGFRDLVGAGLEAFLDFLEVGGALGDRRHAPGVEGAACRLTAASASAALPSVWSPAGRRRWARRPRSCRCRPGDPLAVDVKLCALFHDVPCFFEVRLS
jgi:hypothetical protein